MLPNILKSTEQPPNDKNYLTQDANTTEDEKPSFRGKEVLSCKYAQGLVRPLGSCLLLRFQKKLGANWLPVERQTDLNMGNRCLEGFVMSINPQDPGLTLETLFSTHLAWAPLDSTAHLPLTSGNSGLGPLGVALCTDSQHRAGRGLGGR